MKVYEGNFLTQGLKKKDTEIKKVKLHFRKTLEIYDLAKLPV